jgi:cytochrome c peroxidase
MPQVPLRSAVTVLAAALAGLPARASSVTTVPPVPAQYAAEAPELEATWSPARAALGKRLFVEKRLSGDGTVACIDCHFPHLAFTDGRPKSLGIKGRLHRRNSPTLVNGALTKSQGWDGRTTALEAHVLGPMANPVAMDLPVEKALAFLEADSGYREDFQAAFGGGPTKERLALALAAYHRTLYSVDAPFDRFVAGDAKALGASARRGLALFGGKAQCSACHSGTTFSDEAFHVLGAGSGDDPGRGKLTGVAAELGAFKTPALREVARTAPYMHDGSIATLAEVVEFYDRGGNPHPNLDPRMKPLKLTAQEKADLVAFMEALSGTVIEGPAGAAVPMPTASR